MYTILACAILAPLAVLVILYRGASNYGPESKAGYYRILTGATVIGALCGAVLSKLF